MTPEELQLLIQQGEQALLDPEPGWAEDMLPQFVLALKQLMEERQKCERGFIPVRNKYGEV